MPNREVVAIDLDEVLSETANNVIAHYNSHYGTNVTLDDYYRPAHDPMWQAPDLETRNRRINSYLETDEYHSLKPVEEAIDAIGRLKQDKDLYVVTGRPEYVKDATHRWLNRHFPNIFAGVEFSNFYADSNLQRREKGDICRQIGATVLIDDHKEHAISAATHGVNVLLFGQYPWSQGGELPEQIVRCRDWQDVLNYFYGN